MTRYRLASSLFVSALVSGLFVGLPVISAQAAPTDCPTVFPTADAVDGVTGTGYTVERGTTADPFTAQILGRITDGIAPGIDLIMADLSSPALTRAGGVWEGMSGSPVYSSDGRLIGSVSYGLADTSPIAGITPAADMEKLLDSAAPAVSNSRVKLTGKQAAKVAKAGAVSTAVATQGFKRLPLPVSVSGASSRYLTHLAKRSDVRLITGGARASAAPSSPSEITAGSNFAAALSYGDVTLAGVGTTTFVCNGKAVAFGHPLLDVGSSQYTAHPASSVFIQPDVFAPFKVANLGGPVGVVSKDKTTGIVATLGATATTSFAVTSSLSVDGGAAVTGSTTGIYQPWAADISADHLQANIVKALGSDDAGSAALTFTIKGTRANLQPFTLTRSDHYADTQELSFSPADDLYGILDSLESQPFDNLKITSVDVTGSVSTAINEYRVTAVKIKEKGAWVTHKGVLNVSAGKTIPTQLTLTKYRSDTTVLLPLTIKVPAKTKGATGDLLISDALDSGLFGDLPTSVSDNLTSTKSGKVVKLVKGNGDAFGSEPTSLTALLKALAEAPTNDAVAGTLILDTATKELSSVTYKKTVGVVDPYAKDFSIHVTK